MDTLEVIEQAPERLTEVVGHRHRSARAKLAEAFAAQRHVQDVMVFLRGHGVSAAFAARIVKKYGKDAINVVRANPYRLAHEVWGIGFRTADAIAEKLGIARDAPERLEAGLLHALETSAEDGHLHLPDDGAARAPRPSCSASPRTSCRRASPRSRPRRLVVRETLGDRGPCTSLPWAHEAEAEAAHAARRARPHAGARRSALDRRTRRSTRSRRSPA